MNETEDGLTFLLRILLNLMVLIIILMYMFSYESNPCPTDTFWCEEAFIVLMFAMIGFYIVNRFADAFGNEGGGK